MSVQNSIDKGVKVCVKDGDWRLSSFGVFALCVQEEQKELEEILAKRNKKGKRTEEKPIEEKTILHR